MLAVLRTAEPDVTPLGVGARGVAARPGGRDLGVAISSGYSSEVE